MHSDQLLDSAIELVLDLVARAQHDAPTMRSADAQRQHLHTTLADLQQLQR